MADEFNGFITAIIDTLKEKPDDIKARDIIPYDPETIHQIPLISVMFDHCTPTRLNTDYARYELHADIKYYYARMDAGLRFEGMNTVLAFISAWLYKNQTLGGFSISTEVTDSRCTISNKGGTEIAMGMIHLVANKDNVDIKAVEQGG